MPISQDLAPSGLDTLTAEEIAAMPADAFAELTPEELASMSS